MNIKIYPEKSNCERADETGHIIMKYYRIYYIYSWVFFEILDLICCINSNLKCLQFLSFYFMLWSFFRANRNSFNTCFIVSLWTTAFDTVIFNHCASAAVIYLNFRCHVRKRGFKLACYVSQRVQSDNSDLLYC